MIIYKFLFNLLPKKTQGQLEQENKIYKNYDQFVIIYVIFYI